MPFRIALSGLNAASADLKNTGNNIANAGTFGFKSSRTEFVDVFAVGYGGISSTAIGGGTRLASVSQQFSQGNIDFTDNNLDLAINGQGFFLVSDSGDRLLSRSGAFSVDRTGDVVNSTGHVLQVFPTSGAGFNTGFTQDLTLTTTAGAPQATDVDVIGNPTAVVTGVNLDATATQPLNAYVFPPDSTMYNSSTSLTIYDSLGSQHTLTQYFVKTAIPGEWNVYGQIDPGDGGASINASNGGPGTLQFGSTGTLVAPVGGIIALDANEQPNVNANTMDLTLDYSSTTQYGSPFSVSGLSQSGYAPGRLSGIDIDSEGIVSARYTNGQSSTLGKVALANVSNPQGLTPQGDTVWGASYSAGDLVLGEAGTSSFGLLQSGALEASNVDIAAQLVNLITAQRNFQANAQVISTADTVTQTIINIR